MVILFPLRSELFERRSDKLSKNMRDKLLKHNGRDMSETEVIPGWLTAFSSVCGAMYDDVQIFFLFFFFSNGVN